MPIQTSSSDSDNQLYRWLLVTMLWAVCFLNYADRQSIFSVFPLIQAEFNFTQVQLGIVAGSFMWMYAAFGPAAGWLADRLSAKRLILGALVYWSVMTAATTIAHGYHQLTLIRALTGAGEAFYFPAAMSLIARHHSDQSRSRAMGVHQSAVYIGTMVGGAVSAVIAQKSGWRLSFLLFGAAGVALAAVLTVTLREPKSLASHAEQAPSGSVFDSIRDVLADRRAVLLIGVFVGANFVAVVLLVWLPTFLGQKFHMGLAEAGLASVLSLQLSSVAGVLLGGFAADRAAMFGWTRRQTQGLGLAIGVPCLFMLGWAPSINLLMVAMIGFGLSKGIYDSNIWAALYDVVPLARRGVAAGLMNSIGWLGAGTAPVLAAAGAKRFGFNICLSATSIIYFALAIPMLWPARTRNTLSHKEGLQNTP